MWLVVKKPKLLNGDSWSQHVTPNTVYCRLLKEEEKEFRFNQNDKAWEECEIVKIPPPWWVAQKLAGEIDDVGWIEEEEECF